MKEVYYFNDLQKKVTAHALTTQFVLCKLSMSLIISFIYKLV